MRHPGVSQDRNWFLSSGLVSGVLVMAGIAKDDAPCVLLSLRLNTDEDNSQDDSRTKDDSEEPPDLTEGYVLNERFTKKIRPANIQVPSFL